MFVPHGGFVLINGRTCGLCLGLGLGIILELSLGLGTMKTSK